MADQPRKKVVVVKKKAADPDPSVAASKSAAAEAPAGGASASAPGAGSRKQSGKAGLLDLQRLLDFPAGVAEGAREIWMAGIGALSSVEEAGQALFDDLVRKGESWERESRQRLVGAKQQAESAAGKARGVAQEIGRKPGELAAGAEAQIQRLVEESVEGILHRLGVPTHDEVQALVAHVTALSEKVDRLNERLARPAAPASGGGVDPAQRIIEPAEAPNRAALSKAAATVPPTKAKAAPKPEKATGEPAGAPAAATYRVVATDDGWAVEREGRQRATSRHKTKAEALDAAREVARAQAPSRLVVYKQDGTVQSETTYDE